MHIVIEGHSITQTQNLCLCHMHTSLLCRTSFLHQQIGLNDSENNDSNTITIFAILYTIMIVVWLVF